MVIDNAMQPLSEAFIKRLHFTLKNGTSDSRKDWFAVGEYKRVPNEVGGRDTAAPEEVATKIGALLYGHNATKSTLWNRLLSSIMILSVFIRSKTEMVVWADLFFSRNA